MSIPVSVMVYTLKKWSRGPKLEGGSNDTAQPDRAAMDSVTKRKKKRVFMIG
jgi:hypothetical protein